MYDSLFLVTVIVTISRYNRSRCLGIRSVKIIIGATASVLLELYS